MSAYKYSHITNYTQDHHSFSANSTNTITFSLSRSKGSNPEISQEHDEGLKDLQTLTVSQQHNPTPIRTKFIIKYTIQQQISPENESSSFNFPIN
jgi:hypothetical protein